MLREHKPRGLHQNHLTATALLKALGTAITSWTYSLAAVLRAQGYFLRLHRAAHDILENEANFMVLAMGGPTAEEREFTAEATQCTSRPSAPSSR